MVDNLAAPLFIVVVVIIIMRIREFDSGHDNFLMLYRFCSGKRENVSSSSSK